MGKKGVFKPLADFGSNPPYSSVPIPAKDETKSDEEQEKPDREAQELQDEISHEHDAADDERDADQYGKNAAFSLRHQITTCMSSFSTSEGVIVNSM